MWRTVSSSNAARAIAVASVIGSLLACGRVDERLQGGTTTLGSPATQNDRGDAGDAQLGEKTQFCLSPGQPGGGTGGGRGGGAQNCIDNHCLVCDGTGKCFACDGEERSFDCLEGRCDTCTLVAREGAHCLKCNASGCAACAISALSACTPPTCADCTQVF